MIILGFEIEDRSGLRGLGRRLGKMQKEAITAGAEYWHDKLLARHFTPGNRSRYQFERRTDFYTHTIKPLSGVGQGKFVDLTLKGKSQRFLKAFYSITGSKDRITLSMKPPGYFTKPFIGSFTDPETGKRKTISRQPDKPAETTRTNAEDRDRIRNVINAKMLKLVKDASQQARREKISA